MMTGGSNFSQNIIKNLYLTLEKPLEEAIGLLARKTLSRKLLNELYKILTLKRKGSFHHYFSLIFRNKYEHFESGFWTINFIDKQIQLPLRKKQFWLDWAIALSVLGHETEIKETYISLINSLNPPEFFIDIGTNYGTHSLLFLMQGIKTISFEPNTLCTTYLKEVCTLNNITPHIEEVALGNNNGYIELGYTEEDTWLGSTDTTVIQALASNKSLLTRKVKQSTLDEYLYEICNCRLLLKIDTEGNEYKILQGALHTLKNNNCLVIFESWHNDKRAELFNLFNSCDYRIHGLPWSYNSSSFSLDFTQFCDSQESNFIAISGNAYY